MDDTGGLADDTDNPGERGTAAPLKSAGIFENSPPATTAAVADGNQDDAPTRGGVAYEYLEPVLAAFAAIPEDPTREHLRQRLVAGYLPVVRNVARRYTVRGEPLEDLEQVGCIGLLKAVDRFDPELGCHFLSLAIPTITGEIRRHFRDKAWPMQVARR